MKKRLLVIAILAMVLSFSTMAKAAETVPMHLDHVEGLLSYNRLEATPDPATEKIKDALFPMVAECKRKEWEGLVVYQIRYTKYIYVLVGENDKLDEITLLHSLAQAKGFQVLAAPLNSTDDFISFAETKLTPISSIKATELKIEWKVFSIPLPELKRGKDFAEPKTKKGSE